MKSETFSAWCDATVHHVEHAHRKVPTFKLREEDEKVWDHQCLACGWRNTIPRKVALATVGLEHKGRLETTTQRLALMIRLHRQGIQQRREKQRLTAYHLLLAD